MCIEHTCGQYTCVYNTYISQYIICVTHSMPYHNHNRTCSTYYTIEHVLHTILMTCNGTYHTYHIMMYIIYIHTMMYIISYIYISWCISLYDVYHIYTYHDVYPYHIMMYIIYNIQQHISYT